MEIHKLKCDWCGNEKDLMTPVYGQEEWVTIGQEDYCSMKCATEKYYIKEKDNYYGGADVGL